MRNSFSLKGAVAMLPQLLEISKASLFIMAGADFQLELRSLQDKTYGYRGSTVHAANGFSFTILCYVASALKQRGRIPMLPTCLRGGYVVASISASKELSEEALHQHLSDVRQSQLVRQITDFDHWDFVERLAGMGQDKGKIIKLFDDQIGDAKLKITSRAKGRLLCWSSVVVTFAGPLLCEVMC